MLHRCFEHLLLSSGNFEGAIFLTRIISAIDRFSIRHVSLLFFLVFLRFASQKVLLRPARFEWDLITSHASATLQKAASSSPRRIRPVADRRTPKRAKKPC